MKKSQKITKIQMNGREFQNWYIAIIFFIKNAIARYNQGDVHVLLVFDLA